MNRTQISNVWLTDTGIWVELIDGRRAEERFADYPRLASTDDAQQQNYELSTSVFIGKTLTKTCLTRDSTIIFFC